MCCGSFVVSNKGKKNKTMMKKFTLAALMAFCILNAGAQEPLTSEVEELQAATKKLQGQVSKLEKLKISGYFQGQYQWGQEEASMKVGAANEDKTQSFSRFGIRRGRIKFVYDGGIASGTFQLDITEKGLGVKDAYLNIVDPWMKSFQLRAGIFNRPFGNEVAYSSSSRFAPERSTICQTLFPDERDLGAMLILQAPKTSPWSILKLEAGLFAGNGIKLDTDTAKDFMGHLSVEKKVGLDFAFGAGVSYYNGNVFQGTDNVYVMKNEGFIINENAHKGGYAKREYFGVDAQLTFNSVLGGTNIRAEYLFGQQPGAAGNSKSPNASEVSTGDTYIRNFSGGYVTLEHNIASTPLGLVVKYDWYDPNTKIAGNQVGQVEKTSKTDLSVSTLGFGMLWNINNSLRLTAYYDLNSNEKSINVSGMDKDIKNNLFTLRLQYKF